MTDARTQSPNGAYASGGKYQDATAAKAKEFASDVVDQGSEYMEQAQDVAIEKLGELEKSIRRNPIQASVCPLKCDCSPTATSS